MKNSTLTQWLCTATLAFGLTMQAQEKSLHNMSVQDEVLISATASVQAIDVEKRELTLKGPLGNVETLRVDPAVKRLNEIKVGDEVTAKYYVSIAGELREPTAEERRNPLTIVEGTAKAPKSASPAAGGLRIIRVVATVEGLARPTRMVTLRGRAAITWTCGRAM